MLFAAAVLLFGLPQATTPVAKNFAEPAVAIEETAKPDSTVLSPVPASPEAKVGKDAVPAGESSSVAGLILPGNAMQPGIQPGPAPKPVMFRRYEAPGQKMAWIGLSAVGHSAAAFDAYSTRRAISGGYGTESNPLLRPFANSGAMYVATQVSPTIMDYLGHKMMTNRRSWVRKMWWVPQAAGAGISFTAGVHNMNLVK